MTDRIAGASLVVLGVLLALLPALDWYEGPPPSDPTRGSGLAVAGELWLVPPLALLVVVAGAGILAGRPRRGRDAARWAGPLALVASLLALVFVLWAVGDPDAVLSVGADGAEAALDVEAEPTSVAVLTPFVAGIAATVAAATTWIGWRR